MVDRTERLARCTRGLRGQSLIGRDYLRLARRLSIVEKRAWQGERDNK